MPKVSVVIPTHNRARMIMAAINDVLAQTLEDIEVIVVNDASTDDTASVLAQQVDPRVRVVTLPTNLRIAGARNAGMDAAAGEWIAFHDDDDQWDPTKLEAQLALASDDVDVVYCPYRIRRAGRIIDHTIELPEGDVFAALASGWAPPLGSSIMLRRSAVDERRFDASVEGIEDIDFWLQMAMHSRWAVVADPLVTLAKDAGARATHAIARRERAIEALRVKWLPEMTARDCTAQWDQACRVHRAVARLEGPLPGVAARAGLARDLARLPIGRRTKLLGVARITMGHGLTDKIVDRWFQTRGA